MSLFAAYQMCRNNLEDFWGRKQSAARFERGFAISGLPVQLSSNDAKVLAAADDVLPLYSLTPWLNDTLFCLQIVVQPSAANCEPAPENLVDHIQYVGDGEWMAMQFGKWGHCQIDYTLRSARALLTPGLATRPDLISQCLLNTVFTNYMMRNGFAMLHATALVHAGRLLLLMAPHNSGKSTTALRLVMHGYQLLSDSHVYVVQEAGRLWLTGFPVGRVKLRQDMVAEFPQLACMLNPEAVRNETKYALDLRRLDQNLIYPDAIELSTTDLCLLRRNGRSGSELTPAGRPEMEQAVVHNSMHYDSDPIWANNLALLSQLLDHSRFYHLTIGADPSALVAAVNTLWSST